MGRSGGKCLGGGGRCCLLKCVSDQKCGLGVVVIWAVCFVCDLLVVYKVLVGLFGFRYNVEDLFFNIFLQ